MSEILHNSKYAPGIATYGIKGLQGERGNSGYSLYFTPYDITDDKLKQSIINNVFISDNSNLSDDIKIMKDRKYQPHDLFLTNSGKIYKLNNIKTVEFEKTPILDLSDLINGFIVNTDNKTLSSDKKVIIGNTTSQNIEAPLTIVPNESGNLISLLNHNNEINTTIKIDKDNEYIVFDNSSNICIDNLFINNDSLFNRITVNNKDYYKAVTQKYENISNDTIYNYDVSSDSIKIYQDCEYRYRYKDDNEDQDSTIIHIEYHNGDNIEPKSLIDYSMFEIYLIKSEYISKYIKIK